MPVAKEWDFLPAYYNGNNLTVIGPEEEVEYGQYLLAQEGQIKKFQTEKLDYEAEIGYVIGKTGKNISREDAKKYLFGVTIFNDLSIRDLQLLVMNVGLGPGFGKDWANVLGPCIVTADEFGEPGSNRVTVKVNGQERLNNTYQGLVNSPILEPGEKPTGALKKSWNLSLIIKKFSPEKSGEAALFPAAVNWSRAKMPDI